MGQYIISEVDRAELKHIVQKRRVPPDGLLSRRQEPGPYADTSIGHVVNVVADPEKQ